MHILCRLLGHDHKILLGTRSESSDHSKYCFRADFRCSRCSNVVNKESPHLFVESGDSEDWVLVENCGILSVVLHVFGQSKYEIPTSCFKCGMAGKPFIAKREVLW
jgi:hypothetical protein